MGPEVACVNEVATEEVLLREFGVNVLLIDRLIQRKFLGVL